MVCEGRRRISANKNHHHQQIPNFAIAPNPNQIPIPDRPVLLPRYPLLRPVVGSCSALSRVMARGQMRRVGKERVSIGWGCMVRIRACTGYSMRLGWRRRYRNLRRGGRRTRTPTSGLLRLPYGSRAQAGAAARRALRALCVLRAWGSGRGKAGEKGENAESWGSRDSWGGSKGRPCRLRIARG